MDYHGSRWKKKRKKILRLDGYVCRVAKMYGRTEEANTVHHIYPADEYPEYAWCDWNLISVSSASHNKLENRLTGELTALGRQLMQMTKPGVDWRRKQKSRSVKVDGDDPPLPEGKIKPDGSTGGGR